MKTAFRACGRPAGCPIAVGRPALRCAKRRNCTPRTLASSGSYPERLENAAQSELPVGCLSYSLDWPCGVQKGRIAHHAHLHPPEVILSGWKMLLSPNFPSDAYRIRSTGLALCKKAELHTTVPAFPPALIQHDPQRHHERRTHHPAHYTTISWTFHQVIQQAPPRHHELWGHR